MTQQTEAERHLDTLSEAYFSEDHRLDSDWLAQVAHSVGGLLVRMAANISTGGYLTDDLKRVYFKDRSEVRIYANRLEAGCALTE